MSQHPPSGGWQDPTASAGSGQPAPYPATGPGWAGDGSLGQPPPPAYPVHSYAAPPPAYGYSPYGYPPPPKTNGLAVAALVVSIISAAGLCGYGVGGLLGIAGALLGHFGRRQIRERGESGDGLALAGIIIGWIAFGIGVVAIAAIIIFFVWAINAG